MKRGKKGRETIGGGSGGKTIQGILAILAIPARSIKDTHRTHRAILSTAPRRTIRNTIRITDTHHKLRTTRDRPHRTILSTVPRRTILSTIHMTDTHHTLLTIRQRTHPPRTTRRTLPTRGTYPPTTAPIHPTPMCMVPRHRTSLRVPTATKKPAPPALILPDAEYDQEAMYWGTRDRSLLPMPKYCSAHAFCGIGGGGEKTITNTHGDYPLRSITAARGGTLRCR